jgi:hypothetical protein
LRKDSFAVELTAEALDDEMREAIQIARSLEGEMRGRYMAHGEHRTFTTGRIFQGLRNVFKEDLIRLTSSLGEILKYKK